MTLAITHLPSPRMADCQLTFVSRTAIDYAAAQSQHERYRQTLAECGARVETLEANLDMPDCVFVEDTAIVLDEVAIACRLGTESRCDEVSAVEHALRAYRDVLPIEPPATVEGGDVLQIARTVLVGLSSRTNAQGIERLAEIVNHHGYIVRAIPVTGCLHLKTACTALPDGRLLVHPAWIDTAALADYPQITVPQSEPWGANIACINGRVLAAASHPETIDLIRRQGFTVHAVDLGEFAKAEGGVTCLSILFNS